MNSPADPAQHQQEARAANAPGRWIQTPVFLILLACLMFPDALHATETPAFTPDATVRYKSVEGADLHLHVFHPVAVPASHAQPVPAVVFFFGGGWTHGNPDQFFPHCDYLAKRGMVAISAEYRVETLHGTGPVEALVDAKSAMRWIRGHAASLGIDPNRIAAGGGSAGGHLAAACAVVEEFNDEYDELQIDCHPNALILFNPVIDNGPDGYGHERVKAYWESFSPLHLLTPTMPPTVFFLGTADPLIPVETAERFQALMQSHGNRCDLHLYEGQSHGFFNVANRPYFDQTVAAMDAFLVSLGYLPEQHHESCSHGE